MENLKVSLENCNNIDSGEINIEKNKLNIKFGQNGTGKSTLAKAIQYKIENEKLLNNLLPFKLQKENLEKLQSKVVIEDNNINSVSIFNEEYVKQFLFKEDELVSNSFEIFIKTPKYIENEKNIEKQLEEIKKVFLNNQVLEQIILDFENLSKSFKTTKNGLSDASAISKGLKDGNKIENIPDNIKEYKSFIQNKEKCVSWLDWQIKGNNFIDDHENCPYCISPTDEAKKEKIKAISKNYDKNVIKNFIEIIKVLENLGDYFSPDAKDELEKITKKTEGLLEEEKNYLTNIKGQIDAFLQRLKNLKDVSFHNLKNEKIQEKIENLKIEFGETLDKLKSTKTIDIVEKFNKSLENTLTEIKELQINIGKQKSEIRNSISNNQKNINNFLRNAGYKYEVLIQEENNQHKIKLKHLDFEKNISKGDQHLSFGEKNAFALVLFMYQSLSKQSDLIILDDPISSFDKNKKYAILQMLFREQNSFKGKTVLMFTHDFEPVIDSVKALGNKFKDQTNVSFIKTNKNTLKEKKIEKCNILTFPQIFENILTDGNIDSISKLVYMRRNFEVLNDKGDEYQILSDLFHRRTKEDAKKYRQTNIDKNLSDEGFEKSFRNGENKIKEFEEFSNFKYDDLLKTMNDQRKLQDIYNKSKNGYEKLQIFRVMNGEFTNGDDFDDIFKKFINETYHIENDFIHQLDPREYDLIPEFIIEKCNNEIKKISSQN